MPCKYAMITNVISLKPDMEAGEALDVLHDNKIRCAPVLDQDGNLLGMFSLENVLKHLLPVSARMEDGLRRLDFVVGAAPGIAKRLRKLSLLRLEDIMDTKIVVLHPDTQTWEGIRLLVRYGSPLPVVEEGSRKLCGLMTEQSALNEMSKSPEELEAREIEDIKKGAS